MKRSCVLSSSSEFYLASRHVCGFCFSQVRLMGDWFVGV